MDQALSDVKILDLTQNIAGPFCTKYFADYGADVIKIERPGEGDPARRSGPFFQDDPDPEKSLLFLHLNTNKRSITLNLKSDTGKTIFKELVKEVDVVVENFSPRVMPSLGLSYEELEKINPKLVMTSISNFGQTGPYRDYKASNLVQEGMGHAMYSCGIEGRPPSKLAGSAMEYQGGAMAASASIFALWAKWEQGIGQHVDLSIMEANLTSIDRRAAGLLGYQYTGIVTGREPLAQMGILPMEIAPCADGFVALLLLPEYYPGFLRMLDIPGLGDQFPNLFDMEKKGEFEAIWRPWVAERTKNEIMEKGQAQSISITAVYTTEDLVKSPHFNDRGYWVDIDRPVTGKITQPGAPFIMSETPWQAKRGAPLLGEHNEEVYGEKLGYSKEDLVKLRESGVI
ncbi:MAG: CoA transferase [Chloroflexota bacterium]|nr:CoA transferase [Chloroflexota bacterium]